MLPKHALGVTLVRLRRLLGVPDAIRVADERVSLNPELCWVDAQAFETQLKACEALRSTGDTETWLTRLQDALCWLREPFCLLMAMSLGRFRHACACAVVL